MTEDAERVLVADQIVVAREHERWSGDRRSADGTMFGSSNIIDVTSIARRRWGVSFSYE